jgi:hypothetical protein
VETKVRYNLSEHTSLSVADDFQTANVDDVGDKPRFYLNNALLEASHEFNTRLGGSIWYRNTFIDQRDEALLFDSMEHLVGGRAQYAVTETEFGRPVIVGFDASLGRRDFDEARFFSPDPGDTSRDNPKTHSSYSAGVSANYPLSSLLTLNGRAGWRQRDYETASATRDETTDNVYGGLTLSFTPSPGSPLSLTAASSYEVTDTIVYNIEPYDRPVFETTDALLNNLEIEYRELEVARVGLAADYKLTESLQCGLSFTYQQQAADKEEDLGPIAGNIDPADSGIGEPIEQDQITISATANYAVNEYLSLGVGYQYGMAEDSEQPSGEDDVYQYDTLAILARASF